MKRKVYLFAAMILGLLLQFLVHAGLEIFYLHLLVKDYVTYSLGFSWQTWIFFHHVASLLLIILGIWGGLRLGLWWWRVVYIEHRHWRYK